MDLREKILSSHKHYYELYEWDNGKEKIKVKVKGTSYAERTALLKDCAITNDQLDMVKFAPRMIIATFVDPISDAPIFQRTDEGVIAGLPPKAIEQALAVAMRVCGLSGEATEKKSVKTQSSERSSV